MQARLDDNARRRSSSRTDVAHSALAGRIFDTDGHPMSPAFAYGRGGKLYRYYVSASLQQGGRRATRDTAPRRIAAAAIEAALTAALTRLLPEAEDNPLAVITRVDVRETSLELLLSIVQLLRLRPRLVPGEAAEPDPADRDQLRLTLPLRMATRGGRTEVLGGPEPERRPDAALIRALRQAHAMLETDRRGAPTLAASPGQPWRRKLIRLAFLAPDLQTAILEGRQPKGLNLAALTEREMPLAWATQRSIFGAKSGFRTAKP